MRRGENAGAAVVPFPSFAAEIGKVVCATNAIASVHARIRRAVKACGHFPTEHAALTCLSMAIRSLDPTGTGRHRWMLRGKPALNTLEMTFDGRHAAGHKEINTTQLHRKVDRPAGDVSVGVWAG